MDTISTKRDEALTRLYDTLAELMPGTEEYDKVFAEIVKLEGTNIEHTKINEASKDAKKNRTVQWVTLGVTAAVIPVIDLLCKKHLTKVIGTIEQMETFTSTAGRSISGWFKFKR